MTAAAAAPPRDPAPRPIAECDALRAACDEAYDRYYVSVGRRGAASADTARIAYLAAHDRWAIAHYGGDGTPWNRERTET